MKPQKHQQFSLPRATVTAAKVALNRARIAQQERLVREGKLRAQYLPSGSGAAVIAPVRGAVSAGRAVLTPRPARWRT